MLVMVDHQSCETDDAADCPEDQAEPCDMLDESIRQPPAEEGGEKKQE